MSKAGKIHDLKAWPDPFRAVWDRKKTCEFRRDDRGYEVGDYLRLREYDPDSARYSGRVIDTKVTDIRHGGAFGIPEGYVMMSIVVYVRSFNREDQEA